eukprot:6082463-Amphidinium_carterae.2
MHSPFFRPSIATLRVCACVFNSKAQTIDAEHKLCGSSITCLRVQLALANLLQRCCIRHCEYHNALQLVPTGTPLRLGARFERREQNLHPPPCQGKRVTHRKQRYQIMTL